MKIFMTVLIGAMIAACGCQPATREQQAARQATRIAPAVSVIHDDTRGVTCWIYSPSPGAAISCLPDHQLSSEPDQVAHQVLVPMAEGFQL